jgi:spore coat polysaccharide biosynthesis protein SpsF
MEDIQSDKRIACLVQARMGSSRLPNKSLISICNRPLFLLHIDRLRKAKTVSEIFVLTSENNCDDIIVDICKFEKICYYRGNENNVLERYFKFIDQSNYNHFIRTTADCPFVSHQLLDDLVKIYFNPQNNYDYVSNIIQPSYPYGIHVEVFNKNALTTAYLNAKITYDKEHVTPYIYKKPKRFKLYNHYNSQNISNYNLAVDTADDLRTITKLFHKMNNDRYANFLDAIEILKSLNDD